MSWKVRSTFKIAALALVAPFTLFLVAVEPRLIRANPVKQVGERGVRSLPLGKPNLAESRFSVEVAPGVTHTVIVRGEQSDGDVYTVDVSFQADLSAAQTTAESLISKGYQPRIQPVLNTAPNDLPQGLLGYVVRVGNFTSSAAATDLQKRLAADGFSGLRVVYTGEDGGRTAGPWVVNVLEVDPALFKGKIAVALATQFVPANEQLTSISARTKAAAALNGGYFVIAPTDGTPGDLAGVSIINNQLVSEAVNGRTSLIFPSYSGKDARIAAVSTQQTAIATNGVRREIDGLNRKLGLVRGCGGVGRDEPTESPKHDFTCTDDSELVLFTPIFGSKSEAGKGVEVALNASNRVTEVRERCGGQIPADGSLLCGTGDAAEWLQTNAQTGARIEIDIRVLADGEELPLAQRLEVINGGPRLLRDGKIEITAAAEGFNWQEDPGFYYRFGVRRNPRTLAGIAATGKLLLVAVDGRQPGWSVGASFEESARILQSLGAVNAVNLDGGGSTTITIDRKLVNRPSDATGERPIGDAIVIQR